MEDFFATLFVSCLVIVFIFVLTEILKNENKKLKKTVRNKNLFDVNVFLKNNNRILNNRIKYDYENNQKSFEKGESFEDFTRSEIFKKENYQIVSKSHNYQQNKNDYVLDSLNPDFKFRSKKNNKDFWIECKFRNYMKSEKIKVISENQLKRHNKIKEPCFVLLGVGENPQHPKYLFLIPIKKCYPEMYWRYLGKFRIN